MNLKQNAGFTGLHAYQYAGTQTVAGRAYETNVVQQNLSVRVGPKTRLSYRIMPESTPATTSYPATFVAVDLHFTDGTYLSQLHPTDQHGVPLTASGQGDGKILYTDQWNAESSDLGDVANGKTIDRILFAYDDPARDPLRHLRRPDRRAAPGHLVHRPGAGTAQRRARAHRQHLRPDPLVGDRETLYSSLYLYPNSQFENTGSAKTPVYRYASPVAAPHRTASDITTGAAVKAGKVYVNNGFWDTYRTVWPAYSLLYPEVAADLVDGDGFVQQYRDGGWVARWSSPGYADLMTGTSSDVAFAGAYLRRVPLKDPLATFDAGVKKFTDTSTGESVSWQLEGDINDAGLAQMAAALIKDPRTPSSRKKELADDAAFFADRAGQCVNLFDPSTGFFQGRKADGSFNQSAATYDPESWGGVYTETDGWNFAFHAPQDVLMCSSWCCSQ